MKPEPSSSRSPRACGRDLPIVPRRRYRSRRRSHPASAALLAAASCWVAPIPRCARGAPEPSLPAVIRDLPEPDAANATGPLFHGIWLGGMRIVLETTTLAQVEERLGDHPKRSGDAGNAQAGLCYTSREHGRALAVWVMSQREMEPGGRISQVVEAIDAPRSWTSACTPTGARIALGFQPSGETSDGSWADLLRAGHVWPRFPGRIIPDRRSGAYVGILSEVPAAHGATIVQDITVSVRGTRPALISFSAITGL